MTKWTLIGGVGGESKSPPYVQVHLLSWYFLFIVLDDLRSKEYCNCIIVCTIFFKLAFIQVFAFIFRNKSQWQEFLHHLLLNQ